MKILVLGGCGYIGSFLVNELLKNPKNKITVVDTQWFGKNLKKNKNLKFIKSDIREINKISFKKIDTIIHLANIANDPAVDLNPTLSWDINVLATKLIVERAIKFKVKKFIYASSGSVYGVKKERKVNELLSLNPISVYNKTKMIAERILISYKDKIKIYCIRPATVCGISPRMRFDVSVNMLTLQAIKFKKIKVYGGNQIRPNIHIKDLVNLLIFIILKNIKPGIYNAGFENFSILKIARIISKIIKCKINLLSLKDIRSYRLDSTKILRAGFKPKYGIKNAINEIINKFKNNKYKIKKSSFSVEWLKKILKKNDYK
jgi:nucleoside-diphosphate-sugar epimerase